MPGSSATSSDVVRDHTLDEPTPAAVQSTRAVRDVQTLALALATRTEELGMLRNAQTREVTRDIEVYRVYNGAKPYTMLGKWWSFNDPYNNLTKAEYRDAYVICEEWSPLDMYVKATLKAGSVIIVGEGQSAQCSDTVPRVLHASAALQVYAVAPETSFTNIQTKRMQWNARRHV